MGKNWKDEQKEHERRNGHESTMSFPSVTSYRLVQYHVLLCKIKNLASAPEEAEKSRGSEARALRLRCRWI